MTVHGLTHTESIEISASPQEVYETVRQLERMGEWSPENTGGRWLSGDGTSIGDRFEGDNKIGDLEWSVVSAVHESTPGEAFAFHTGEDDDPFVNWTYQMEPTEAGTKLTEIWDVVKLPPRLAAQPIEYLPKRIEAVQASMRTTLERMKASIEG